MHGEDINGTGIYRRFCGAFHITAKRGKQGDISFCQIRIKSEHPKTL
jgi:hypothetical protein